MEIGSIGIAGVTGVVANGGTVADDGGAMAADGRTTVDGEITIGITMTTTKENTASITTIDFAIAFAAD